jgi:hypothetical protein
MLDSAMAENFRVLVGRTCEQNLGKMESPANLAAAAVRLKRVLAVGGAPPTP